jgi:hypothetical protein
MSIKQTDLATFRTITSDDWKHGLRAARERRKGAAKRIADAIKRADKITVILRNQSDLREITHS